MGVNIFSKYFSSRAWLPRVMGQHNALLVIRKRRRKKESLAQNIQMQIHYNIVILVYAYNNIKSIMKYVYIILDCLFVIFF